LIFHILFTLINSYWIRIFISESPPNKPTIRKFCSSTQAKRKLDFNQVQPNDPEGKQQKKQLALLHRYLSNHTSPQTLPSISNIYMILPNVGDPPSSSPYQTGTDQ
jgi:hypothetical protein